MSFMAMHTLALLIADRGDERVQGFWDREKAVFESAENTDGFIARRYVTPGKVFQGPDKIPWVGVDEGEGPYVHPRFYGPEDLLAATLTVWTNLEEVAAFSYRNRHQEALGKRTDWFIQTENPVYVTWWVDEPLVPSWTAARKRIEQLHDEGPSASAFNFKTAFGPDGQPMKLDRPTLDKHAESVL